MTTNYGLFNQLKNIPDLNQTLKSTEYNILYNRLNCMRVAIVDEFYPENLTVKTRIANKQLVGLNKDGSQILQDFPPIYAKVHFFGWGDVGATFPITKGMEGFLLFNDREIESWYVNGDSNPLAYNRSHNWSDAVFICGIHSLPNMIDFVENCLHLYYKNSNIQINENNVIINGNTVINGNLTVNGTINATGDIVANGISLLNHVHGGVQSGGSTTGVPQ